MRIYFMSICGTGMGNGALLMRALGHTVAGADRNTYPPMSERLREAGIEVLEGYDADRLASLDPDLVVLGNVNTRGNPEVEWLLDSRRIRVVSLPQLLAEGVLNRRQPVVVAGTHGKTTTTAIAAFLLQAAGLDPGYLVGGVPLDLPGGAHPGREDGPFVIEGDEYDSAFFDKRSKFIHYCPRILLINNLEFDHADIFRDIEDVKRSFRHLIKLVPRSGCILANGDDPEVEELLHIDWTPVYRVGQGDRSDLQISDFEENARGSSFRLAFHERDWGRIQWPQWGFFNARNAAMAALAAAFAAGHRDPTAFGLQALGQFKGVRRRQEILACTERGTVLVDFAHHPTAVRETLASLRRRFPSRHLVACFEPRSNTSCLRIHQSAYELAFDVADEIHLGPVFRAERYADSERIDLAGMARRLGNKARAYSDHAALKRFLLEPGRLAPGSVVVFFSNGSFENLPQELAGVLEEDDAHADGN